MEITKIHLWASIQKLSSVYQTKIMVKKTQVRKELVNEENRLIKINDAIGI